MRNRTLTLLGLALPAWLLLPAAGHAQLARLQPQLEQRVAQFKGDVGVSVIDLKTGERIALRGDEQFPSASVIKLPILVELFHQLARGPLKLTDAIIMNASDQRPGSGILQFFSTPHQLTLGDAATFMMIQSDNTATNFVIDRVGIRNVNARLDSLGLRNTRLHSKVFLGSSTSIDTVASHKWGFGVTTSNDMASLFAFIYRGQIVSDSVSHQIVGIMKNNFADLGISRYMPAGVSVANKSGELNESRHDCGIVYNKQRDFIICVLTKNNQDASWRIDNEAELLIADLTRMTYQYLTTLP